MDKAKLQQFIDKQLKHIEQIQLRVGGLSIECPPEELAALCEALNNSVTALSTLVGLTTLMEFNLSLPKEEPDFSDTDFEREIIEAQEQHKKKLEELAARKRGMRSRFTPLSGSDQIFR